MTEQCLKELDALAEGYFDLMREVRRHLHAHPEPSGEEHRTSLYIRERLLTGGYDARLGPDGRGVLAELPGREPGPRVALRADIDALRIQDAKTAPYRSREPEVMHACGHDGHSAAVLGAMLTLAEAERRGRLPWPARWRGIFQPAEETSEGARDMIDCGALEGVSAALSLHMDPSRKVGRIGYRWGTFTAACDALCIRIDGRGGHAARPHESLDPIAAAAQLINSLYLFIPRATDSHEPVVVTIGQLLAGENSNVIPEHATLRGTLRTLTAASRERTKEHIRRIAAALAAASGTRITVEFEPGPRSVDNDRPLTELIREAAAGVVGRENLEIIPRPSMGGEDFAFYLDHVPGAMFRLGCAPPEGAAPPLHSPLFDLEEEALLIGARVLARAVVLWSDPEGPYSPAGGEGIA